MSKLLSLVTPIMEFLLNLTFLLCKNFWDYSMVSNWYIWNPALLSWHNWVCLSTFYILESIQIIQVSFRPWLACCINEFFAPTSFAFYSLKYPYLNLFFFSFLSFFIFVFFFISSSSSIKLKVLFSIMVSSIDAYKSSISLLYAIEESLTKLLLFGL